MLRLFMIILFFIVCETSFAQKDKKPVQKEKPPTQKEIEEMMKEMQKAVDEMDPEAKKMMDSMGIKVPTTKSIPQLTDKQWANATEDANRIVPKREPELIAAIPKAVTNAKMAAYILAVQTKIASSLKPSTVSMGNKVYDYAKSKSKNPAKIANTAMGLYMAGQPELALYVLGKLCASDASNTDYLSNYASLLSMLGAQHLAIPILNNLLIKYPKNSTLYNNLGQAWFGLGEISKAEKYLDSAIRIYSYHPQANVTKSLIKESKGDKQGAIDAMKHSIAKDYSLDKENRLNKLGYQLTKDDVHWDKPMPADPLGLEKFKWPEYPMKVNESKTLEIEWDAFKKRCQDEIAELKTQEAVLEKAAEEGNNLRMKQVLQMGKKGTMVDPLPITAHKAMVKLKYLIDDKDNHTAVSYEKKVQAMAEANIDIAQLEDELEKKLEQLAKKYEDQFGEGKPNPFDAACGDDTQAKDNFLNAANTIIRNATSDFIDFMRRKINNETYYYQYTMWPENFELAKTRAKIMWLGLISGQNPKFKDKSGWCRNPEPNQKGKKFMLAKFDDVACKYNDTLDLGIMSFYNNCSRMTSKLNLKFVEYSRFDDFERAEGDTYMNSTIKFSAEQGFDKLKWEAGPLKLEAKAGVSIEFELDRSGVKDVIVGAEAKMGIGHNQFDEELEKSGSIAGKDVIDTTLEGGVEGRISLVSGHGSIGGSGEFSKIRIIEW